MGNTFGTSNSAYKLIDPREARASRERFRREAIPELRLANSLYVPVGDMPARGWILLTRETLDALASDYIYPLAYWQFENNLDDATGNGNTITSHGGITYGPGVIDQAVKSDSTAAATAPAILSGYGNFSLVIWYKSAAVGNITPILRLLDQNGSEIFNLRINLAGKVQFGVSGTFATGGTTVDNGSWHFIVATWDQSTATIYVDNALDGSQNCSWTLGVPTQVLFSSSTGSSFSADLGGVYGVCLNTSQISQLYNSASGVNYSGALLPDTSIGLYRNTFRLQVDQFDISAPALTFKNLSIVQARCVSRGLASDSKAVYLVELTDGRGILGGRFFQYPTEGFYNVLSPAYPTLYYQNSLNSGATWTWSGMIQSLWDQMGDFLGAFPGLPYVPGGTPTNWNLPGVSAWKSLNIALYHLGMGISCDLTSSEPYGIVSLGADDATFTNLTTLYSGRLQDDWEWIDTGSGRVPGTVIVYFRRVNQYYGTEETVTRTTNQWATDPVYAVPVSAPPFFVGATGTGYLWDDFVVRYDVDGNPLAADIAFANSRAIERVKQYFDLIYSRTSGAMRRTYAGVLPFYAGSQVDGVCWRQDMRSRAGWETQVIRGELWKEVYPDES